MALVSLVLSLMAILFLCSFAIIEVEADTAYDKHCAAIIQHAQKASRLYNTGKVDDAMKEIDKARESYQKAVAVDMDEPQAHYNMANFLLNVR